MTKPSAIIKVSDEASTPKASRMKKYTPSAIFVILSVIAAFFAGIAPASAAAAFCCGGTFNVQSPSQVTLTVTSYLGTSTSVDIVITTPSAEGSSQVLYTETTEPATDDTPEVPNDLLTPSIETFGPYVVSAGATITATIGGTLLDSYTNTTVPDPIQYVVPEVPFSNGTHVTIPTPTAAYQYVDSAGNVLTPGTQVAIPVGGRLTVTAELTNPNDPTIALSGNTSWFYDYVAPAPMQAIPPQVSFDDQPGTENDTITLTAGTGFGNPVLNGVSYQPGTYNVAAAGIVDGKGCIAVEYAVLAGYSYRFGASYKTNVCFSETTPPPADTTETTKVEFCHATSSDTNPYVLIETSVNAFYQAGHIDHEDDIWPAFTYVKQGETINVAAQGDQAILASGCKVATQEPTPTDTATPTPTDTATPKPTETVTPTPTDTATSAPTQTAAPAPTASAVVEETAEEEQVTKVRSIDIDTAAVGTAEQATPIYKMVLVFAAAVLLLLAIAMLPRRKDVGTHR